MMKALQRIIDIEIVQDENGQDHCLIYLDPVITLIQGLSHRAIQGWRYLPVERAPKDIGIYDPNIGVYDDMPEQMAAELRELCLI